MKKHVIDIMEMEMCGNMFIWPNLLQFAHLAWLQQSVCKKIQYFSLTTRQIKYWKEKARPTSPTVIHWMDLGVSVRWLPAVNNKQRLWNTQIHHGFKVSSWKYQGLLYFSSILFANETTMIKCHGQVIASFWLLLYSNLHFGGKIENRINLLYHTSP